MKYIFFFLLALSGCNSSPNKEAQKNTPLLPVEAAAVEKECDADFDVFFERFRTDSVYQRKHVKFPLKTTFLDLEGDLSVMREDIPENKYSFSIFKNDKEIGDTGNGLYKVDILKEKDSAYYQINGIDNGIGTQVTFAFIDGCWYMIAVEDSST